MMGATEKFNNSNFLVEWFFESFDDGEISIQTFL